MECCPSNRRFSFLRRSGKSGLDVARVSAVMSPDCNDRLGIFGLVVAAGSVWCR